MSDQVLVKFKQKLIQGGAGSMRSYICINLLILLGKRKNCLRSNLIAHQKINTPERTYCYRISLLSTAHKI